MCHWATTHSGPVIGVLLVAPPDVDSDWAKHRSLYQQFRPVPMNAFQFPTMLVASPVELYGAKWPLTRDDDGWCGDYEKKKLPSVYENRAPELA